MVEPPLQTLTAQNFEETVKPSGEEYIYKGDLHGGKTTMLYLNLSGH